MAQKPRESRRKLASEKQEAERAAAQAERQPRVVLKPETRHGILIIILLTTGAIGWMSVFGWAGVFGDSFATSLGVLFGWTRYIIPGYLTIIGLLLLFPERYHLSVARWVGFGLALVASQGLLQLFLPHAESVTRAIDGQGGGYVGVLIDYPTRAALGPVAAALVMLAILVIGLLIMFNTTLQALATRSIFFAKFYQGWRSFWWQRRLSKIQGQPVAEETGEAPEFAHAEMAGAEVSETEEEMEGEGEEETLVPLPPKPVRRPKRNITIPLDLLDLSTSQPTSGNIEGNKEKIQRTLQTFGINVEMGEINVGPTVTQYTLKPAEGVKLAQITSLNNDLALALAAHPIRIEAPIPGQSLVGIEVPNKTVAMVNLRDILGSDQFKTRKSDLTFSLGKDVSGRPWVSDLGTMPHLLIAGATGSGKSVMVNGLILSMLYSNSPDDLKLILVDPKRVELSLYNGIPHLMTPVITDTTKTINALRWVVSEMDRRYMVLQNAGKRNIASYRKEVAEDMPYLVVVIDELADLMTVAANEVEAAIVRLAQMARAVGIHLVLATQRPSVDVITGLIKANVTARIAFSVASQIDSRTILDNSGAEKLLGRGDMLFISAELSKPKRLQGAYVGEKEVERVTQFLKGQGKPEYVNDIVEKTAPQIGGSLEDLGDDELLTQAKEVIIQSGKASASLLQRRLRVGYARAARILDLLEEEGFIGPGEGAKPREVFGDRTTDSTTITLPSDMAVPLSNSIPTPEDAMGSDEEIADDEEPQA